LRPGARGRGICGRGRASGACPDQDRARVAHAFAAQDDAAGADEDRHGHPVIAGPQQQGAAKAVGIERQRREPVDRRLQVCGVVPGDRPERLFHRHGGDGNAAAAISRVRRVVDCIALFVGYVDQLAVGARIDARCGRGQVLGARGRKQRRRRSQLQNASSRKLHAGSALLCLLFVAPVRLAR